MAPQLEQGGWAATLQARALRRSERKGVNNTVCLSGAFHPQPSKHLQIMDVSLFPLAEVWPKAAKSTALSAVGAQFPRVTELGPN